MPKTRKLALMAMLTAASLIVFIIEAQIPPLVPIQGVKLGLANMITLVAMLISIKPMLFVLLYIILIMLKRSKVKNLFHISLMTIS